MEIPPPITNITVVDDDEQNYFNDDDDNILSQQHDVKNSKNIIEPSAVTTTTAQLNDNNNDSRRSPPRLYLLYGIIILQTVIFLSEMIIDQMVHSMLILADAYHHLFNSFNAILLVVCYKVFVFRIFFFVILIIFSPLFLRFPIKLPSRIHLAGYEPNYLEC